MESKNPDPKSGDPELIKIGTQKFPSKIGGPENPDLLKLGGDPTKSRSEMWGSNKNDLQNRETNKNEPQNGGPTKTPYTFTYQTATKKFIIVNIYY